MNFVFDYYSKYGKMPDPIYLLILIGVLVILLAGLAILEHRTHKK